MKTTYDTNNTFAKILRGDLPCKKIAEGDTFLAFHNAFPKAPVHGLVIPKGFFINFHDFMQQATPGQIQGFYNGINQALDELDVKKIGYRLISNCGVIGGQEVAHYHVHILSGGPLGAMV